MGSRAVGAQLCGYSDAERKAAKRAEARLSRHLQRLEGAHLRRLALLAREQRQLQTQLQRLQEGFVKKKCSSYFGDGLRKRPEGVRVSPPRRGWTLGAPQAGPARAPAGEEAQGTQEAKPQMPPSHHAVPTECKPPSPSQNHRPSHFREDRPPAGEEEATRPAKGCHTSGDISALCQGADLPGSTAALGPGASPAGDSGRAHGDEATSGDASLQPDHSTGQRMSPRPPGHAGSLKGESSAATYLELYAKAGHAHYLRHRVPPESERMLSVGEIFGHRGPEPQSRQ